MRTRENEVCRRGEKQSFKAPVVDQGGERRATEAVGDKWKGRVREAVEDLVVDSSERRVKFGQEFSFIGVLDADGGDHTFKNWR